MAPNAMGISSRDCLVPVRRLTCSATGIMMARAPTFLVTIDNRVTAAVSTGTWLRSVFRCGRIRFRASSTMPDLAKAADTTRAQAMITVTSLEKPSNAASAGITPMARPATRAATATRS